MSATSGTFTSDKQAAETGTVALNVMNGADAQQIMGDFGFDVAPPATLGLGIPAP